MLESVASVPFVLVNARALNSSETWEIQYNGQLAIKSYNTMQLTMNIPCKSLQKFQVRPIDEINLTKSKHKKERQREASLSKRDIDIKGINKKDFR